MPVLRVATRSVADRTGLNGGPSSRPSQDPLLPGWRYSTRRVPEPPSPSSRRPSGCSAAVAVLPLLSPAGRRRAVGILHLPAALVRGPQSALRDDVARLDPRWAAATKAGAPWTCRRSRPPARHLVAEAAPSSGAASWPRPPPAGRPRAGGRGRARRGRRGTRCPPLPPVPGASPPRPRVPDARAPRSVPASRAAGAPPPPPARASGPHRGRRGRSAGDRPDRLLGVPSFTAPSSCGRHCAKGCTSGWPGPWWSSRHQVDSSGRRRSLEHR